MREHVNHLYADDRKCVSFIDVVTIFLPTLRDLNSLIINVHKI